MASIFTYEPEPARVASPWSRDAGVHDDASEDVVATSRGDGHHTPAKITRLCAEPQQGPVEYKLHLLLRPRRKFSATSTGRHISGSKHSNYGVITSSRSVSESALESAASSGANTPSAATTQQARQHRLEQLTTQLLWRLQQSSPHHTSSATNIILPSLPEALPELQAPHQPARLLHGLEESQGALYEIGVSDDGTLVGLADDELRESLNNLRAMAACLGCSVKVLREETVGECEWLDDAIVGRKTRKVRRSGKLLVAEAFIEPCLQAKSPALAPVNAAQDAPHADSAIGPSHDLVTEQLRITLTGPTMSGKSSLLGTLTTSTLDNGRGKSRLSMLKHRHEITSGVTSSVTQELLGYQDNDGGVNVVNYATENVASWIDVHVAAAGGRLVFVSDSAGHPRYRRTTIRSLVGWAPHWTLLCVPADDTEDTAGRNGSTHSTQHDLAPAVADMDLSGAQLDLCLRLGLPMVIVITKLDLASRSGLKSTLSKVLDALKAAGRKPIIIPNPPKNGDLQRVEGLDSAYDACLQLLNDRLGFVPIVLTSAVDGTGISSLHALIHELPVPDLSEKAAEEPSSTIFHIEDIFTKPAEVEGIIISGRLRTGELSVGDSVAIGPFSSHEHLEDSEDSDERSHRRRTSSHLPTSRSFPGALRNSQLPAPWFQLPTQEWRRVRISSIRNLRLPVHSLSADQVGTIAIVPEEEDVASLARVRKGMVLSAVARASTRTFVAQFQREDVEALAIGNHVVVYIASIRASAKVVSARAPDSPIVENRSAPQQDPFSFDDLAESLDAPTERVSGAITAKDLLVTFSFDTAKEFVMVGDQVLVMPGGGQGMHAGHERGEKGAAGLEGFVGVITEALG